MADTKTSLEAAAAALTGAELVRIVQSGGNAKATLGAIAALFTGGTMASAINEAPPVTLASAATVAIGAAAANTVNVSGALTITAFDTIAAGALRCVIFTGAPILSHNATSLILPGAANIQAAAGDSAFFESLGGGNWRCVAYQKANGQAIIGGTFTGGTLSSALNEAPAVTIASAATVGIGAATANAVTVSGTVTITAFDTIADGALRAVTFSGALILTHNATSLILPGAANITTAAGDVGFFRSLGGGNWRCVAYTKASGAALVGGGGLTHLVESYSTTAPNSVAASAMALKGLDAAATDVDVAFGPKASGAISANLPDAAATGGNKRGANAVDWQNVRVLATEVASGLRSGIASGYRNTASNAYAFVGGGSNNTASGDHGAVAGGDTNNVSSTDGFIGGGQGNTVSGNYSGILSGYNNLASGVSGEAGGRSATTRGVDYVQAFANLTSASGVAGSSQNCRYHQKAATTDATTTAMSADGSASAANLSCVLPNSHAFTFSAKVVARQDTGSVCAGFIIEGLVKRLTATGNAAIVGTPTIRTWADAGAATWTAVASVIASPQALVINVTGEAGKTIAWRCTIDCDETS